MEQELYTPKEAAEYLRTTTTNIYNYIRRGKLKAHKVGDKLVRITKEELKGLLK